MCVHRGLLPRAHVFPVLNFSGLITHYSTSSQGRSSLIPHITHDDARLSSSIKADTMLAAGPPSSSAERDVTYARRHRDPSCCLKTCCPHIWSASLRRSCGPALCWSHWPTRSERLRTARFRASFRQRRSHYDDGVVPDISPEVDLAPQGQRCLDT